MGTLMASIIPQMLELKLVIKKKKKKKKDQSFAEFLFHKCLTQSWTSLLFD